MLTNKKVIKQSLLSTREKITALGLFFIENKDYVKMKLRSLHF